ncbi:MAG: substrate-binding domain-containing protein [Eubacteriales bacterium]|nr:substrate-binding domain-containing protein [Eubacteriales bacterium]
MNKENALYLAAEQPFFTNTHRYEDFIHGVMSRLNKGISLNIIGLGDLQSHIGKSTTGSGISGDVKTGAGNGLCEDIKNGSGDIRKILGNTDKIIIAGISSQWLSSAAALAISSGIRPISAHTDSSLLIKGTSSVTFDYYTAASDLTMQMLQDGRKHIVFFGMDPDPYSSSMKYLGYHDTLAASDVRGRNIQGTGVYSGSRSMQECTGLLLSNLSGIDAVLCVNDYSALILINALKTKGVRVPEDIAVAGFENTIAGSVAEPSLTSASIEYYESGRKAVEICNMMDKDALLSGISLTLGCTLHIRGSAGGVLSSAMSERGSSPGAGIGMSTGNSSAGNGCRPGYSPGTGPVAGSVFNRSLCTEGTSEKFYNDPDIHEVIALENMLRQCDDFDGMILGRIAENMKYEDMAEDLNMSEKTIQYRLNKMLASSRKRNRADLLSLINKYLSGYGENALTKAAARIAAARKPF